MIELAEKNKKQFLRSNFCAYSIFSSGHSWITFNTYYKLLLINISIAKQYISLPSCRWIYYYLNWIYVCMCDSNIKLKYCTFENCYSWVEIYFNSAIKFNKNFFIQFSLIDIWNFLLKNLQTFYLYMIRNRKNILCAAHCFHNFFQNLYLY